MIMINMAMVNNQQNILENDCRLWTISCILRYVFFFTKAPKQFFYIVPTVYFERVPGH